eukprot:g20872.t1
MNAIDFWQKINPGEKSFLSLKSQATMRRGNTTAMQAGGEKSWSQLKKEEQGGGAGGAGSVGGNKLLGVCCPCIGG